MIYLTISLYSLIYGIDQQLAFKMAHVESSMNPLAISRTNDGGLYQLNQKYFKFHNEQWRYSIETNTAMALSHLAKLKKTCKHQVEKSFVLCYNLGEQGAKRIKNPSSQNYFKKMNILYR